jgi:hypothetical protein
MKTIALSIFACCHLLLAINLAHAEWSDKPVQAGVTAADGSDCTTARSLWLKGRIRFVRRACERGDEATAAAVLTTSLQRARTY